MVGVRAITIWEPWASLIALGFKAIETRSWKTDYRGPILVTSAKRWSLEQEIEARRADDWIRQNPGKLPPGCPDEFLATDHWRTVSAGRVLCVAELIDCQLMDEAPTEVEDRLGYFGQGRYGWQLKHVRRLRRPVSVKGRQGLWVPSADTVKEVMEQFSD